MANNYTQSSSWLTIPKAKLGQADEVLEKAFIECLKFDAKNQGIGSDVDLDDFCSVTLEATIEGDEEADDDRCGIWIRDNDESFDPGQAEIIARMIVEELQLDESYVFCCSWANICSKQRIDEFGGGAFALARGRMTVWVDAMSYVQDAINLADSINNAEWAYG